MTWPAESEALALRPSNSAPASNSAPVTKCRRRDPQYLHELPRVWKDGTQEQCNWLPKALIEVVCVENEKVVAIRPRLEFQPLFAPN